MTSSFHFGLQISVDDLELTGYLNELFFLLLLGFLCVLFCCFGNRSAVVVAL